MNILADTLYTADDLLRMTGDEHYELVDGKLVEKGMGVRSSLVARNLITLLGPFARGQGLGEVFESECGYVLFPDLNNRVRKPDVSFVRRDRFPTDGLPRGWFRLVPDLAVEIISPNDTAEEVAARITDYLRAGVALLWIVDPESRLVQIFRRDCSAAWLLGTGELKGEDVLPGFVCRVEDVFAGL